MPDAPQRLTDKYKDVNLCDMTPDEREDFLSGIAQRGAMDALMAVGLSDAAAVDDIRDLRDLLKGFRVVKRNLWMSALSTLGRVIGWAIVIAIMGMVVGHSDAAKSLMKLMAE